MNLFISDNDIVYLETDSCTPTAYYEYYESKLCFQRYTGNDRDKNIILIHDGDRLCYDALNDIYTVPNDIDMFQRCFLLRLIIDAEELKRGNLPLHMAAVGDGSQLFLIAAPPQNGKSYLTHEICRKVSGFETIGDDHIILSPQHIQGNVSRRLRSKDNKTVGYEKNKGLDKICTMTWICVAKQEINRDPFLLSGAEAFNALAEASAFKYLNETFAHNEICYPASEVTDFKIDETYRDCFNAFIKENSVIILRGTLNYIEGVILDIIKNRGK